MKRYILKRLVTAFFIVMVVIVLNFTIIKLAPGDPVRILAGDDTLTEEVMEAMTVKFGLDQPFHVQISSTSFTAIWAPPSPIRSRSVC